MIAIKPNQSQQDLAAEALAAAPAIISLARLNKRSLINQLRSTAAANNTQISITTLTDLNAISVTVIN